MLVEPSQPTCDLLGLCRIGVSSSPSSTNCVDPASLPKPFAIASPAGTLSWNRLPPCARMTVTPVRVLSASIRVTWPTSTPGYIGDRIQRAGRENTRLDTDLAGPYRLGHVWILLRRQGFDIGYLKIRQQERAACPLHESHRPPPGDAAMCLFGPRPARATRSAGGPLASARALTHRPGSRCLDRGQAGPRIRRNLIRNLLQVAILVSNTTPEILAETPAWRVGRPIAGNESRAGHDPRCSRAGAESPESPVC